MAPHRIPFSVEQARKVISRLHPSTHYWQEAARVLAEAGTPVTPPSAKPLSYRDINDDDSSEMD